MKILLINQPLGNRGDESAHRALIRAILNRIPNVEIRVLFVDCYSPWSVEQYDIHDVRVEYIDIHSVRGFNRMGHKSLKQKHFCKLLWEIHPTTKAILNQYRWADVIVCAPGGINLGGFQDWRHLYMLKLAEYTHTPLAYFGRSFGPFAQDTPDSKKFYNLSCEILQYFSYLSIRDHRSALLADKMGLNYIETVDTAFLDSPKVHLPYEIRNTIKKPYVVMVPNELTWHYAYKGKISRQELVDFYTDIAKSLLNRDANMQVVMLPQLYGTSLLDVDFFRDIADSISDSRVVVLPDCYSSDVQQSIIKEASILIGARYHSIVFALNQSVPFIALSYEHKISGLLERLKRSDVCIDITEAILSESGRNECLEKISKLLPIVASDYQAQEEAKKIAAHGFDQFINFIDKYK